MHLHTEPLNFGNLIIGNKNERGSLSEYELRVWKWRFYMSIHFMWLLRITRWIFWVILRCSVFFFKYDFFQFSLLSIFKIFGRDVCNPYFPEHNPLGGSLVLLFNEWEHRMILRALYRFEVWIDCKPNYLENGCNLARHKGPGYVGARQRTPLPARTEYLQYGPGYYSLFYFVSWYIYPSGAYRLVQTGGGGWGATRGFGPPVWGNRNRKDTQLELNNSYII